MEKDTNQEPEKAKLPVLNYQAPPPVIIPLYRRIMAGLMVLTGIGFCVMGIFMGTRNPAALTNVLTIGGSFIVWGLVIRYQHVRLW